MPEGDTIHHAARRVGAALVGNEIVSIETPHPRHRMDRWPERLAGRGVRGGRRPRQAPVHALRGRPDAALAPADDRRAGASTARGERWTPLAAPGLAGGPHRRARGGPVRRAGAGADDRLAHPLRPAAGRARAPTSWPTTSTRAPFLRRLREDDPTRGIGDALLDQRNVAGIGNMWKARAASWPGSTPGGRPARVTDDEAAGDRARSVRPLMQRLGARAAFRRASRRVYERAGRPCPRCGTLIRSRGQGDDNRTTYWCPRVPVVKRVGHKGADHVAPGQHPRQLRGRARARRRHDRVRRAPHCATAGWCWPTTPRTPASASRSRSSEGLDHFAGEAYAGVELDVDMKIPGYEREVVEGLRARGLTERSLISTNVHATASTRVGELDARASGAAGRCRACGATTRAARSRCPPTWSLR